MPVETLEYTWAKRPDHVPLTTKELEIALKLADWDVEEAAKHLRIDVGRLAGCLTSRSNAHLAKKVWEKTVSSLVSVRDFGNQIAIVVKKPKRPSELKAAINEEGNLEAVITFINPRADELRQLALKVLEGDPHFDRSLFENKREAERQRDLIRSAELDPNWRKK